MIKVRDLGEWPIQQKDNSTKQGWRTYATLKGVDIYSVCYSPDKVARLNQLNSDIKLAFPDIDKTELTIRIFN